jgi:hypothetical protein
MKSNELINFKELTYKELEKVSHLFQEYPWENKEAYVDFISNVYDFLKHACRLLASAASRCNIEYDIFFHRFIDHASEEKNHEKLVLNDLKALGTPLQQYDMSVPPIWQTQFYMIEHVSPLSLFGYILFLENLSLYESIGPHVYKRCLEVYGKKATSYLRVHVEEDPSHVDKLFDIIDKLPQGEHQNVVDSLLITSSLYRNFLIELMQKHKRSASRAA